MVEPLELADLAAGLQVERGELISLVGGGGKTTTLFALARQLGGTTVLTTTTKMGAGQSGDFPVLISPADDELRQTLHADGRALVWHATDGRRAIGVSPETCDRWFEIADNVIVEADGSRKRPFKAPAPYEPVVPTRTTLLIACVGARAFGRPIAKCCHRPELVAELANCRIEDDLTPRRAAAVLLSAAGSRKSLPPGARFAVAVHRVDDGHVAVLAELADHLGTSTELVAVKESNELAASATSD